MIKICTLLTLAVSAIACSRDLLTNYAQSLPISSPGMPTQIMPTIAIERVSLIAREEKNLPPGQPPSVDRPIGFADVFIRLKNPENIQVKCEIQRIEIRNALLGNTYMTSNAPESILLKPLEISENSFRLTNRNGYPGFGKVKAVVTYQVGNQVKVIESSPVAIDRH